MLAYLVPMLKDSAPNAPSVAACLSLGEWCQRLISATIWMLVYGSGSMDASIPGADAKGQHAERAVRGYVS